MSFPSVASVLKERGLDVDHAKEAELHSVLWEAFGRDLPAARSYLIAFADEVKGHGEQAMREEDPKSDLGQGLARLCGTDVARKVCEKHLGVNIAFLNCCNVIAAPKKKGRKLIFSARDQILLQKGERANC